MQASQGNINGQLESQYVLGAIALVERELIAALERGSSQAALEAHERLTWLKTALVSALRYERAV